MIHLYLGRVFLFFLHIAQCTHGMQTHTRTHTHTHTAHAVVLFRGRTGGELLSPLLSGLLPPHNHRPAVQAKEDLWPVPTAPLCSVFGRGYPCRAAGYRHSNQKCYYRRLGIINYFSLSLFPFFF